MKTSISAIRTTTLLWSCLVACFVAYSCNSSPSASTSTPAPEPSYRLPDQITLTASAIRDASDGTVIEGTTNLPFNTKLGVELMTGGRAVAQDLKVYVDSGRFRSAGFRKGASPIPPGKQRVHIFTYFNTLWQSESVMRFVGASGSNLKPSAIIHSEDAQLIDGDKMLDYTVDLIVPPLGSAPAKTNLPTRSTPAPSDKAIKMVKQAVLVVDGSRSSMSVEEGVTFLLTNGVRMGDGWSATPAAKDTFNVVLDFINGDGRGKEWHDKAMWEVNVVTKKVLDRNKYAKDFSWIPKD